MFFAGRSVQSGKTFYARASNGTADIVGVRRANAEKWGYRYPSTPWRIDSQWRRLIAEAWAIERPFIGQVRLETRISVPFDEWHGWEVRFTDVFEGVEGETRMYGFDSDGRVERTS
jgi:hypothetical protein